jgi:hypothetical protein
MDLVNVLIAKIIEWVDKLIKFFTESFGLYTTQYSKYIMYGILIFLLSKIFKIKWNLNLGGKK